MNNRGRANDDRVEELSFDDDNQPPPRPGDPYIEPPPEINAERARKAGLTSGEVEPMDATDALDTDDDLSPSTLFDEPGLDDEEATAADKELTIVDKNNIGAGYGLDEAELARTTGRPN